MEIAALNTIYIYKKLYLDNPVFNDKLVEYWFLPARNLYGSFRSPSLLYQTYGFKLGTTTIHSIFLPANENEIKNTDADAILLDIRFSSLKKKLSKFVDLVRKPVILSLNGAFRKTEKIIDEAKIFEQNGVSAILTGYMISNSILAKIKNSISIPVISKSVANANSMIKRHQSGADLIAILGMKISQSLIQEFKQTFPFVPIIAFAGNSEEIISNSLSSGVDAIIYNPRVHVNYFK